MFNDYVPADAPRVLPGSRSLSLDWKRNGANSSKLKTRTPHTRAGLRLNTNNKQNKMKTQHDSLRKTNSGRSVPGLENDQPPPSWNPQEKTIAADKIGFRTWASRWWDGQNWQYVKADRQPRLNAKFLTRTAALRAAGTQLHVVNKNKLGPISQTR